MAIPTKNKSYTGTKGIAEVRVLTTGLRVIFSDGDTYTVNSNGWDRPSGVYSITLAKTNDEIKFAAPPGRPDPYLVKFVAFANRVGRTDDNPGVPEPKLDAGGWRQGKNGPYFEDDKLVASAKLEVVEKGPYKGLTIPYKLPYIFAQYPGTLITMLEGTAGERKKVETFLRLVGLDMVNDEIPWSANVLPYLEFKLQEASKIFTVRLNDKGFIDKDGLGFIPDYAIDPDMLEDEAPKKKATSKAKSNGKAGAKKAARK